jgi:hypothetical protein
LNPRSVSVVRFPRIPIWSANLDIAALRWGISLAC